MSEQDPAKRKELWFKLVFSLFGLALMCVAIFARGIPNAPALVEVVGVAGLFFGGSAVYCALKLFR
ncbi:hypothetical protein [Cognatishimia sp. F0-27]|uniref:hypothetical protein n=1 Tax=Cognatishimia sp. F0-27 TaxID=2816855 RepID=UPI001D0BF9C5|nr:hypothetical protein [Cognatishimia sp. F0-27]MCC1490991.1 hypothetical protein [Cognatishimia sp. F0-27]